MKGFFRHKAKHILTMMIMAVICTLFLGAKQTDQQEDDDPDVVYTTEYPNVNNSHVYTKWLYDSKRIPLPLDSVQERIFGMKIYGERIYFVVEAKEWSEDGRIMLHSYYVFNMKTDGSELQKVKLEDIDQVDEYFPGNNDFNVDMSVSDKSRYACILEDEICLYDQLSNTICQFAMDGKLKKKIDLEQRLDVVDISKTSEAVYLVIGGSTPGVLKVTDKNDMTDFKQFTIYDQTVEQMYYAYCQGNKVYLCYQDTENPESSAKLGIFDLEKASYMKECKHGYACTNGFYVSDSDRVYFLYGTSVDYSGKDYQKSAIDGILSGISFDKSGVDNTHFLCIDEEHFLYADDHTGKISLNLLSHMETDPKELIVIEYFTYPTHADNDWVVRADWDKIVSDMTYFNATNSKYRIANNSGFYHIEDEIEAGTVDIVAYNSDAGIPVEGWAKDGKIACIDEYFKKDRRLSGTKFFENVWDAYRVNGKLYEVIPSFGVRTFLGKESIFGNTLDNGSASDNRSFGNTLDNGSASDNRSASEGESVTDYLKGNTSSDNEKMTLDQLRNIIKAMPEDTCAFGNADKTKLLLAAIQCSMSDFIDVEKKECYFDTQYFYDLLEYIKNLPETGDEIRRTSAYQFEKSLLLETVFSNMKTIEETANIYFGNEEISYVGFPSEKGVGASLYTPGIRYVISSNSKHKEGAWEFVSRYLLEENADPQYFSVNQEATRKMTDEKLFDFLGKIQNKEMNAKWINSISRDLIWDYFDGRIKAEELGKEIQRIMQEKVQDESYERYRDAIG